MALNAGHGKRARQTASAADLESDIVYAILMQNPAMGDGKTLFHADHGNLVQHTTAQVVQPHTDQGHHRQANAVGLDGRQVGNCRFGQNCTQTPDQGCGERQEAWVVYLQACRRHSLLPEALERHPGEPGAIAGTLRARRNAPDPKFD